MAFAIRLRQMEDYVVITYAPVWSRSLQEYTCFYSYKTCQSHVTYTRYEVFITIMKIQKATVLIS